MVFHLTVLREEVRDYVPHPEMGKSPIVIKYSGEKLFANCLHDLLFPCMLHVDQLLELPRRLRMVAVEISRGDAICPKWDDESAWIGQDDERVFWCHECVDIVWM